MITAPFLFITNMAILPESARTAAAYLGGGIARGLEKVGGQVAQQGGQVAGAAKSAIGQKAGEFLQNVGSTVQGVGATAGKVGGIKKRDIGLAAAGAAMTGAFVGGMGANSGIHALMGYQTTDLRSRPPQPPAPSGAIIMPADLQTGYVQLNQYGSPLGMMQLRQTYDMKEAQQRQRTLRAAMDPNFNLGGEQE